MRIKKVFELNASNTAINPSLLLRLIYESGLQLESHPAQIYGLQAQLLQGKFSSTPTTDPVPSPEELLKVDSKFTLFGFPVKLDEGLPKSVIQLRNTNGELLGQIDCLAVPSAYTEFTPEEEKAEQDKLNIVRDEVWYRSRYEEAHEVRLSGKS